ncbi:PE-PPE domain-containing protein [Mycolicibacterium chlorophenolicum]|uniref:Putative PPE family protein PPE42 n=1 Tax=Mycolicibacterium chlorophenolicum TaxID=37916 RepID=A0A0J6VMR6_9MYCO|nr:PE-PPE domain-containing protein [Mycolicibacterium chlorophenolicum]KMO70817.1 putative PPE family protein PPE42 [Mycolicibacterium chlorophenolicum]
MRTRMRRAGVACGAFLATVGMAFSVATSAGASSSALVIGGIATPSLSDIVMAELLGGTLKGQPRVSVNWPAQAAPYTGSNDLTLGASINVGITNLNAQIDAALGRLGTDANGRPINGEKVTVVGLSAGSLVVNEVLRQMDADPDAPDKNEITFIVVADSSRQSLIDKARYDPRFDYTYQPAPETKYDIIVVTGEYDGMADFPDRWWNLLAVANAVAGSIFVHVPVMFADLSKVPAENIDVDVNSKGGNTTHYLVPTEKLPLVRLFPSLASREAELKATIDAGYSRNDPAPASKLSSLVASSPAAAGEPAPQADAQTPSVETEQPVEPTADATEESPGTAADESAPDDETTSDDQTTPAEDTTSDDQAAIDTDGGSAEDGADSDAHADEDPADTAGTPAGDATAPTDLIGSATSHSAGSDDSSTGTDLPEATKTAS